MRHVESTLGSNLKKTISSEVFMDLEQAVAIVESFLSNSVMEPPSSFVVEELAKSIAEFDDLYRELAK